MKVQGSKIAQNQMNSGSKNNNTKKEKENLSTDNTAQKEQTSVHGSTQANTSRVPATNIDQPSVVTDLESEQSFAIGAATPLTQEPTIYVQQ